MSHPVNKPRPTRLQRAIHQWLPLLLIALCLPSCSRSTDDMDPQPPTPEIATANHYINLSIVVSSGSQGTMRVPTAKGDDYENGDGREAGYDYENEVEGVTFILYEVEENTNSTETDIDKRYPGINDKESQDKTIAFIRYYTVRKLSLEEQNDKKFDEAIYTTDKQSLEGLDLSKKYRAIVIANQNLTGTFTVGRTTVADICNESTDQIFKQGTGIGLNASGIVDASGFVMSQECESPVISFDNPPTVDRDNEKVYDIDNIRIERLAARVDFWTKNATYDLNKKGYVYDVYKSDGTTKSLDYFVLKAVVPFNIYKNTAPEYLIKHIQFSGEITYFSDETRANYVIDPQGKKTEETTIDYYNNPLSGLISLDDDNQTLTGSTGYYMSMQDLYEAAHSTNSPVVAPNSQLAQFEDDRDKDNFILCYPKENTLSKASPLYYYATGVAIEGDYYTDGEDVPEHRIYYGFLRHQGEGSSSQDTYDIYTKDDFADVTKLVGNQGTPMNFSVVRNNIYRISIEKITEKQKDEDPKITIHIKVKKWDIFTHDIIYM